MEPSIQTGCCYYRMRTNCGRKCMPGRTCWTMEGTKTLGSSDCDILDPVECSPEVAAAGASTTQPLSIALLVAAAALAFRGAALPDQPLGRARSRAIVGQGCSWAFSQSCAS